MKRIVLFGVIAAFCVTGGAWAVLQAAQPTPVPTPVVIANPGASTSDANAPAISQPPARPHVIGLSISPGFYGLRGVAASFVHNAPSADRYASDLACERISFNGESGICLERGVLEMTSRVTATVFGPDFKARYSLPVDGIYGSRTRISPDGRYGAFTTFVEGHSYADASFSTATEIIALADGSRFGNLETWSVTRNGAPFSAPDFNFWGVTFARDSNRFYATLATGGAIHLVEGDIAARAMRVLADDVECPALSPDETRVAFKKRSGLAMWRLHVYDLRTGAVTPLAETANIDDQAAWLDDAHVLYGKIAPDAAPRIDTWVVNADGSGQPRLWAENLQSVVIVR
jgi:Tol biopolymer transport system component